MCFEHPCKRTKHQQDVEFTLWMQCNVNYCELMACKRFLTMMTEHQLSPPSIVQNACASFSHRILQPGHYYDTFCYNFDDLYSLETMVILPPATSMALSGQGQGFYVEKKCLPLFYIPQRKRFIQGALLPVLIFGMNQV